MKTNKNLIIIVIIIGVVILMNQKQDTKVELSEDTIGYSGTITEMHKLDHALNITPKIVETQQKEILSNGDDWCCDAACTDTCWGSESFCKDSCCSLGYNLDCPIPEICDDTVGGYPKHCNIAKTRWCTAPTYVYDYTANRCCSPTSPFYNGNGGCLRLPIQEVSDDYLTNNFICFVGLTAADNGDYIQEERCTNGEYYLCISNSYEESQERHYTTTYENQGVVIDKCGATCASGLCCDTTTSTFKPSGTLCGTATCPADTACKIYNKNINVYCSGSSVDCPTTQCSYQDQPANTPCENNGLCDGNGACVPKTVLPGWCFQEDAATSTCWNTIGSYTCSGTFDSANPCNLAYNGNWKDYASTSSSVGSTISSTWIKPTKPFTQVKYTIAYGKPISKTREYILPSSCVNAFTDRINIRVSLKYGTGMSVDCQTGGSTYTNIMSSTDTAVLEDAVSFNMVGDIDCNTLLPRAISLARAWVTSPSDTTLNTAVTAALAWAGNC